MSLNDVEVDNTVEISVDIYVPSTTSSNTQPRLSILNKSTNVGVGLNWHSQALSLRRIQTNSEGGTIYASSDINLFNDTWYTMKLKANGSHFIGEIYNGSTLLGTISSTVSNIISDASNYIGIQHCYTLNAVIYWKNLKLKAL